MSTKIPWVINPDGTPGETWNPMTGCTPASEGCEHCYAKTNAHLYEKAWGYDFTPRFHPDRLDAPLHWRKPRTIFVCSMGDLFHEAFTDEQRDAVLATVAAAGQHTFMLLTKRPDEMQRYLSEKSNREAGIIIADTKARGLYAPLVAPWPLPNLWLGVTVENPNYTWRIDDLMDTPAAVRFVSYEPAISAVDFQPWLPCPQQTCPVGDCILPWECNPERGLDWVILGGENGPGARPMQLEWALDVWRSCKAAGVPFFFKGWGGRDNHIRYFDGPMHEMETTHELPAVTA